MTAELLVEQFAIRRADADRALDALSNDLMDARIEGEAPSPAAHSGYDTLLVVQSTEEVESPTAATRTQFAEAVGDLLTQNGIEWVLAVPDR